MKEIEEEFIRDVSSKHLMSRIVTRKKFKSYKKMNELINIILEIKDLKLEEEELELELQKVLKKMKKVTIEGE
jgi:hypothetical protein